MPQANEISVTIGGNPVTFAFERQTEDTSFYTTTDSVALSRKELMVKVRRPVRPDGPYKVTLRVKIPIVVTETINGVQVPKLVGTDVSTNEYFVGPAGNSAVLRELSQALGADTSVAAAVDTLRPLYA